jgi:hypothetical protein
MHGVTCCSPDLYMHHNLIPFAKRRIDVSGVVYLNEFPSTRLPTHFYQIYAFIVSRSSFLSSPFLYRKFGGGRYKPYESNQVLKIVLYYHYDLLTALPLQVLNYATLIGKDLLTNTVAIITPCRF